MNNETTQEPVTNQEPQKQEAKRAVSMIPIDSKGRVLARNHSELLRFCGAMIKGEGVPKRFNNAEKLFAALMFVRDLGLPDTAIRQVAQVHGVMTAFGDIPLALVQRSGKLSHFDESWFDKEYKFINFENKNLDAEVYGAVVFVSREGDGDEKKSFSFTLEDARKADLYPATKWDSQNKEKIQNPDSPWMKYTKLMLRYRARSIALKSKFADIISGMAIGEYDFSLSNPDEAPNETRDVTPADPEDMEPVYMSPATPSPEKNTAPPEPQENAPVQKEEKLQVRKVKNFAPQTREEADRETQRIEKERMERAAAEGANVPVEPPKEEPPTPEGELKIATEDRQALGMEISQIALRLGVKGKDALNAKISEKIKKPLNMLTYDQMVVIRDWLLMEENSNRPQGSV